MGIFFLFLLLFVSIFVSRQEENYVSFFCLGYRFFLDSFQLVAYFSERSRAMSIFGGE